MQNPRWYKNPLVYLSGLAVAGLIAGYLLTRDGKPVTTYPTPPSVTAPAQQYPVTPQPTEVPAKTPTAEPTSPPAAEPAFLSYLQSEDGLARIECGNYPVNCTREELQRYLDQVYKLSTGERVNAVVADAYTYVGDKLVKQNGKKLLLYSETDYDPGDGGLVRVEWEFEGGDASKLDWLTEKSGEVYKFVADTLRPSRRPDIYITVSKDGTRSNITVLNRSPTSELRKSQISFYPWHVTDDFGQMTYEMAVTFNRALGYTDESRNGDAFLSEFWGSLIKRVGKPNMGLVKEDFDRSYLTTRSQVTLGLDVYKALVIEGFDGSKLTQLAQRLEGKKANWDQFKAEAKAIAGKDLPTLDSIDESVKLWRNSH